MTFAHNWDVYFHMINHYKKIKNAKAVVDCSSPKGYNGLQENNPRCVPATCPARAPRTCSPDCPRSRPACSGPEHHRCASAPHKSPGKPPCWKGRNTCRHRTALDDLEPADVPSPFRTYLNRPTRDANHQSPERTEAKRKMNESSENSEDGNSDTAGQKKIISVIKAPKTKVQERAGQSSGRPPEAVPVSSQDEPKGTNYPSDVKEHEYVYFLLKITEDILRNNIYVESEIEKLFESHIEANKGRLDEGKMRQQVEQLRTELLLPLSRKDDRCDCGTPEQQQTDGTAVSCACKNPDCPHQDKDGILKEQEVESKSIVKEPEEVKTTSTLDSSESDGKAVPDCECQEPKREPSIGPIADAATSDDSCVCNNTKCFKSNTQVENIEEKFVIAAARQLQEPLDVDVQAAEEPVGGSTGPERACNCDQKLAKRQDVKSTEEATDEEKPPQDTEKAPTAALEEATKAKNDAEAVPEVNGHALSPTKPSGGTSAHSIFKMKGLTEDTSSQIVFYDNGLETDSDRCICTLTLQKKALKIQVDDKDEEYILVDGPVCIPRSMLEKKTIPVLIQNVSSVILTPNEGSSAKKASDSKVNLFPQVSQAEANQYGENMDSISGFIQHGHDADYDMMPEREVKDETSSKKEPEPILRHEPTSNGAPKTASFYEDLVSVAQDSSDGGSKLPPTVSCAPCGFTRNTCIYRRRQREPSEQDTKKMEFVDKVVHPDGSQRFDVTTKDEDAGGPSGEEDANNDIPSMGSADYDRKYHYLLVDVATSTSSFKPSAIKERSPSVQSEESSEESPEAPVPLVSPSSSTTPKDSVQDQYMLLVDEQYETEQEESVEVPEKRESDEDEDSLSRRLSSQSTVDLATEVDTLFAKDKGLEAERQLERPQVKRISETPEATPRIFQYPTISEQIKVENELTKRPSDSIQERLSIAESYRRASIMTPDPEMLRNVKAIESLTTPLPFQNHPPVLKQNTVPASTSGVNRPHEGLKVRYSLTRDFFDPQQLEVLKKLETVPSNDENNSKDNNMAAINEKMKEFRKIDESSDAQRRFQITNPEHFEIRRVELLESSSEHEEEDDKNKRKKKAKVPQARTPSER